MAFFKYCFSLRISCVNSSRGGAHSSYALECTLDESSKNSELLKSSLSELELLLFLWGWLWGLEWRSESSLACSCICSCLRYAAAQSIL